MGNLVSVFGLLFYIQLDAKKQDPCQTLMAFTSYSFVPLPNHPKPSHSLNRSCERIRHFLITIESACQAMFNCQKKRKKRSYTGGLAKIMQKSLYLLWNFSLLISLDRLIQCNPNCLMSNSPAFSLFAG